MIRQKGVAGDTIKTAAKEIAKEPRRTAKNTAKETTETTAKAATTAAEYSGWLRAEQYSYIGGMAAGYAGCIY